jgi:hypothetical protein
MVDCAWIDGDVCGCAFRGEIPVRYGEMRAEGETRGRRQVDGEFG